MTRIADSSFLIAAFDKRDSRQTNALAALTDPSTIEVPVEVLGETLGIVQKRMGSEIARSMWQALRSLKHIRFMAHADHEATAALFLESKKLSWVDAAVVHWCRTRNATALAYDPDIERLAKAR